MTPPDNAQLTAIGYTLTPSDPFANVAEFVMRAPDGKEWRSAIPGNLWAVARAHERRKAIGG